MITCVLGAPSAPGDFGRVALPMLAALAGVASTLVAWRTTASVTTYAAASTPAAVADLAAGVGLLAAGAGTLIVRPGSSTGTLATALIGATWLAHDWVGWEGAPAVARSVAMVAVASHRPAPRAPVARPTDRLVRRALGAGLRPRRLLHGGPGRVGNRPRPRPVPRPALLEQLSRQHLPRAGRPGPGACTRRDRAVLDDRHRHDRRGGLRGAAPRGDSGRAASDVVHPDPDGGGPAVDGRLRRRADRRS